MGNYQPLYPNFEYTNTCRKDCGERYKFIKGDYGSFKHKTMIDIGCANGYFGFNFLLDGGKYTFGLDENNDFIEFINKSSKEHKLNFQSGNILPDSFFDIGIYLDLHYHKETDKCGYLDFLSENCKLVYTTSCKHSEVYKDRLKQFFSEVEMLCTFGYQERILYKCFNKEF